MSQSFFHYRIESAFELPLPEAETASTETIRVVRQSLGNPETAERHEWEGDSPFMYCEKLPAGYDLVFDQYLRARISVDKLDVQIDQQVSDSSASVHFLLDQILPRTLGERGELVLHGGAVSESSADASALVLLGATGSGKSTLCASFLRDGWSLLSDDCVYVDPDTLGVLGSYPGLRMYRDSVDTVLGQETMTRLMAGYSDKQRICAQLPVIGERRLGAFVVLEPGEQQLELEMLGGSEALMTVMQETFCLWPANTSAAADRLAAVTAVLSQDIPVYRCQLPHDYHCLDEVKTVLCELL